MIEFPDTHNEAKDTLACIFLFFIELNFALVAKYLKLVEVLQRASPRIRGGTEELSPVNRRQNFGKIGEASTLSKPVLLTGPRLNSKYLEIPTILQDETL